VQPIFPDKRKYAFMALLTIFLKSSTPFLPYRTSAEDLSPPLATSLTTSMLSGSTQKRMARFSHPDILLIIENL
jgi:hypothetical protein